METHRIKINRAPVLTLWATVVAEKLGYDHEEALTLAQAVTRLDAVAKGKRLGIYEEHKEREVERRKKAEGKLAAGEVFLVDILGRTVTAKETDQGVRAVVSDGTVKPEGVERYLEGKFGPELGEARRAMEELAESYAPGDLADKAYTLYAKFRPDIPGGARGWGARGDLDLDYIRSLAGR